MLIGYARVSTKDQKLDLQRDALHRAGCERIFEDDGVSGALFRRPALDHALEMLVAGDQLIVWKLDRLGRELLPLIAMVYQLGDRGIVFRSLTEVIDCSTPGGRFNLHVHAAMAEFERSVLSERTRAGMLAARKRGRQLGRPPALTEAEHLVARQLIERGETPGQVAHRLKVSFSTLRRTMNAH